MTQARVTTGASGQKKVADFFQKKYNATIVSIAKPGSNFTDIVLKINGKTYNVEVKGTKNLASDVSIFDVSSSRGNTDFHFLNEISKSMLKASTKKPAKGKYKGKDFLYGIDLYRVETGDMTVGFPLDEGVTSRGGKLPPYYRSSNNLVLKTTHSVLMEHFIEKNDNFFTIVYNEKIYAWYTGKGSSPISNIKKLDVKDLKGSSIASYGVEYYRKDIPERGIKAGDLRGVLRTALKIKFNITPST